MQAVTAISASLGDLTAQVTALVADLEAHKVGDITRWNEVAVIKEDVRNIQSQLEEVELDPTQLVDIETAAQGSGYVVPFEHGGVVDLTATILLLGLGALYVNGELVWSTQGLSVTIGTVSHRQDVKYNDVITCSGLTTIVITPYVPAVSLDDNPLATEPADPPVKFDTTPIYLPIESYITLAAAAWPYGGVLTITCRGSRQGECQLTVNGTIVWDNYVSLTGNKTGTYKVSAGDTVYLSDDSLGTAKMLFTPNLEREVIL